MVIRSRIAAVLFLAAPIFVHGWVQQPQSHFRPRSNSQAFPLYVIPPTLQQDRLAQECLAFMENHEQEQQALLKRDSKIYSIPFLVAFLSFTFFVDINHSFHFLTPCRWAATEESCPMKFDH